MSSLSGRYYHYVASGWSPFNILEIPQMYLGQGLHEKIYYELELTEQTLAVCGQYVRQEKSG